MEWKCDKGSRKEKDLYEKQKLEELEPIEIDRRNLSFGEKYRQTKFSNKIKALSGINEELLGEADKL